MSTETTARFASALERAARWRLLAHLVTPPCEGWAAELAALAREDEGLDADDDAAIREAFRVLRPAGPVSACASDHVRDGYADKGPILGDAAGFYAAFGFQPAGDESPDHFSTLLSFLSFLALKEAWALSEGDEDQVGVTVAAARAFEDTHLHPYLARFAEALADHAPEGGLYRTVAARLTSSGPAAGFPTGASAGGRE